MLFASKFQQIDRDIDVIETQIAVLQEKLSELQSHRQQLQSVEQAAESAINQIQIAKAMINEVDESQMEQFKNAIDAEFKDDVLALPEAALDESEDIDEPEPVNPEDNQEIESDDVVDVTSRPLASVGAAGFNPADASMDELKAYVRGVLKDSEVREYGILSRKATWLAAAKAIQ